MCEMYIFRIQQASKEQGQRSGMELWLYITSWVAILMAVIALCVAGSYAMAKWCLHKWARQLPKLPATSTPRIDNSIQPSPKQVMDTNFEPIAKQEPISTMPTSLGRRQTEWSVSLLIIYLVCLLTLALAIPP